MACSGQPTAARRALSSSSAGTGSATPATTKAWPSSSLRSNNSGAVSWQRAWPWHTSASMTTRISAGRGAGTGREDRGHGPIAVHGRHRSIANHAGTLNPVVRHAAQDLFHHDGPLGPADMGADTAVGAQPEAHVPVRETVEDHVVRSVELLGVPVGRRPGDE